MDLVFLHGPAAASKLTVARSLSELTGIPVFHNHLVIDLLLEVFEFGSPEFVQLRERFWLDTFATAAAAGRSLVFTFSPEATVPQGFTERTVSAVAQHGGRVRFVQLSVSSGEQERRIENVDRKQFRKLASIETLRRLRSQEDRSSAVPPSDVIINTEAMSPPDAAALLVNELGLVTEPRRGVIPPALVRRRCPKRHFGTFDLGIGHDQPEFTAVGTALSCPPGCDGSWARRH